MGGICFIWPASAFLIAEWILFFRNARRLERPLGICCGLVGALAVFALGSAVSDAVVHGASPGLAFWFGFTAVCLSVATYGLWCGWLRFSRRTLPQEQG